MRKGNFFYQQQKEYFVTQQHSQTHNHEPHDEFCFAEQENILIEELPVFAHSFSIPEIIKVEMVI